MVFGNKGDTSGSGVAFSRDEVTGAPEPSGDFLVNAQGEDVVSGVRNTLDIADMKEHLPEAYDQAVKAVRVGRQLNGAGARAHFDQLGVYRLLSLVSDPEELHDLAQDPAHGARREHLHAALLDICDPIAVNEEARASQRLAQSHA